MTDVTDLSGVAEPAEPTDAEARFLQLSSVRNLRDAGGYPAGPGRSVRRAALLRAATLHYLKSEDAEFLAELGLRTVIDLRTPEEIRFQPDNLAGLDVATHRFAPLRTLMDDTPGTMAELYLHIVDTGGQALADAIRELARPGALPALVHCTAGKDRTGLVVAMVHDLLGVCDADIVEDYLLSNGALAAILDAEGRPAYHAISADLIESALGRMREGHGSVAGYLRFHGLEDEAVNALRSALLV